MGFAKTSFLETYKSSPWKKRKDKFTTSWPLFNLFYQQDRITYLDYKLTHLILSKDSQATQEQAFFLCHLIRAAKEGHLCIKIKQDTDVLPDVWQLWQNETALPLSNDEIETLNDGIIKGSKFKNSNIITRISECYLEKAISHPLCQFKECFYLQRYWLLESIILKQLRSHLETSPQISFDKDSIIQSVQTLSEKKQLLPEQAQAILSGCLNTFSIIAGGPGTGKTYTAGQLIKVFWNNLSEEQRKTCHIAVAAPTGKAVANIQKNLSTIIADLKELPDLTIKTLHSLLGIKSSNKFNQSPVKLSVDLLIVDESSMIDANLMATLFESIKKGSRVVFLGDQHQLPSVEAGSVFAELVELCTTSKNISISTTFLKTCLRTDLKSIIDFSQLANAGRADQVLEILNHSNQKGISKLEIFPDNSESQKKLLKHVIGYFSSIIKDDNDRIALLNLFQSTRLLSPMRKGLFGVEACNEMLWKHFSQTKEQEGWLAIPIMVVTNDYRRDLFNGETGTLMKKLPLNTSHEEDYALFPSRNSEEKFRRIPLVMLPKYEYAYCLSVHKSQGSEFDRIILLMPEGSEVFGREVFYTGITRAREQIDICGTDEVIRKTINIKGKRLSGISERLI